MKTKSKLATDIKSLVLAKAKVYARNKAESSSEDEKEDSMTNLRRATEADKERKREKMRLKKQRKKEARAKSVPKDSADAKSDAIKYLHLWNTSKESWCFRKKLQCWLLNNTFNVDNVSNTDFEILLEYIVDLKGAAKSRLIEESEKVIQSHEQKSEDSISDADVVVFERARSILQILF